MCSYISSYFGILVPNFQLFSFWILIVLKSYGIVSEAKVKKIVPITIGGSTYA